MTATEILRRLLDERGVEYVEDYEYGKKYPPERSITWSCDIAGEDMTVTARDYFIGDGEYCLDLEFHEVFTPEQAISATLGAGTCHEVMINRYWRGCSECGYVWENMYAAGFQIGPNYCPMCGRRIKQ